MMAYENKNKYIILDSIIPFAHDVTPWLANNFGIPTFDGKWYWSMNGIEPAFFFKNKADAFYFWLVWA